MAAVASLSVFAQAALVAHGLLVPHTLCFEHGAVAHEDGHAHDGANHAAHEAPSGRHAWVHDHDGHALEDEHCTVLGTQHTPAPQIFESELTDQRVPSAAQPAERSAAISTVARYRTAPKTSPPSA